MKILLVELKKMLEPHKEKRNNSYRYMNYFFLNRQDGQPIYKIENFNTVERVGKVGDFKEIRMWNNEDKQLKFEDDSDKLSVKIDFTKDSEYILRFFPDIDYVKVNVFKEKVILLTTDEKRFNLFDVNKLSVKDEEILV